MKNIIAVLFITSLLLLFSCGGDSPSTASNADATNAAPASKKPVAQGNTKGKLIFKQYCVVCHGMDGKLAVSGAKDLSVSVLPIEERINQITNGKGLMTPYKDILSTDQIQAVSEYLVELRK